MAIEFSKSETIYNQYAAKEALNWFDETIFELDDSKTEVQWAQTLSSIISTGIKEGTSIDDLSEKVVAQGTSVAAKDATRAVRTNMTCSMNKGILEGFEMTASKTGEKVQKQWLSTLDDKTRPSHVELNGEIAELDEQFSNGLRYPGDGNGAAEEIMNCRCTMTAYFPDFEDEDQQEYDPDSTDYADWLKQHYSTIGTTADATPTYTYDTSAWKNWTQDANVKMCQAEKVAAKRVKTFAEEKKSNPTEDEAISRICGADKTKGSCASAAYAYVCNLAGIDVLDFRGGHSQETFSYIMQNIIVNTGVSKGLYAKGSDSITNSITLMRNLTENVQYMMCCCHHCAIVRKTGDGVYQYLELQADENSNTGHEHTWATDYWRTAGVNAYYERYGSGWVTFTDDEAEEVFSGRFGGSSTFYRDARAVEIDSLMQYNNLGNIAQYIQTKEDKQKKGKGGTQK